MFCCVFFLAGPGAVASTTGHFSLRPWRSPFRPSLGEFGTASSFSLATSENQAGLWHGRLWSIFLSSPRVRRPFSTRRGATDAIISSPRKSRVVIRTRKERKPPPYPDVIGVAPFLSQVVTRRKETTRKKKKKGHPNVHARTHARAVGLSKGASRRGYLHVEEGRKGEARPRGSSLRGTRTRLAEREREREREKVYAHQ